MARSSNKRGGLVSSALRYLLFLAAANLALLLALETVLRLFFGMPHGIYHYRPVSNEHVLLPNASIYLVWAPIPYTIETNSLGLRGPEMALRKPAGSTRIIALGDSVTEGFYVNNPNTYPVLLQELLAARGCRAEVANISRGGIAIDTQTALLKRYGFPLEPDTVVLTFVSNDIEELRGKTREEILAGPSLEQRPLEIGEWLLFARTAIGELVLDKSLEWQYDAYRTHKRELHNPNGPAPQFPGAEAFRENARRFLEYHARPVDGIAYYEEFNADHLETIRNYGEALRQLHALCREREVHLVFVYYPDYAEVYLPERPFPLAGMLQRVCEEEGIPYLNLLPAFRAHPGEVLHFAPRDFHPNAAGNRVIAEAIAGFLVDAGLAGPCAPQRPGEPVS